MRLLVHKQIISIWCEIVTDYQLGDQIKRNVRGWDCRTYGTQKTFTHGFGQGT
jgi:hypothetical protein